MVSTSSNLSSSMPFNALAEPLRGVHLVGSDAAPSARLVKAAILSRREHPHVGSAPILLAEVAKLAKSLLAHGNAGADGREDHLLL